MMISIAIAFYGMAYFFYALHAVHALAIKESFLLNLMMLNQTLNMALRAPSEPRSCLSLFWLIFCSLVHIHSTYMCIIYASVWAAVEETAPQQHSINSCLQQNVQTLMMNKECAWMHSRATLASSCMNKCKNDKKKSHTHTQIDLTEHTHEKMFIRWFSLEMPKMSRAKKGIIDILSLEIWPASWFGHRPYVCWILFSCHSNSSESFGMYETEIRV